VGSSGSMGNPTCVPQQISIAWSPPSYNGAHAPFLPPTSTSLVNRSVWARTYRRPRPPELRLVHKYPPAFVSKNLPPPPLPVVAMSAKAPQVRAGGGIATIWPRPARRSVPAKRRGIHQTLQPECSPSIDWSALSTPEHQPGFASAIVLFCCRLKPRQPVPPQNPGSKVRSLFAFQGSAPCFTRTYRKSSCSLQAKICHAGEAGPRPRICSDSPE